MSELDYINSGDQFIVQYTAIRKIIDQSDHMKENLDKYFTDAETLVDQWASE